MAQSSLVAETKTPLDERGAKKSKPWPRRAIIPFAAVGLLGLLAAGYLWLYTPRNRALDPAVARLKAAGQKYYAKKKYDQAIQRFRGYLRGAPADWRTRDLLADSYWRIGDGRRAFAELTIVNQAAVPNGDRFYRLGLLAGQIGKEDEAVAWLRRSVDLKPKSLPARVELAKALAKKGQYDESVVRWEEALGLLPEKDLFAAIIYAELGDVLRLKGDDEKAKEAYRRGLEIEPGNVYLQAQVAAVGGP